VTETEITRIIDELDREHAGDAWHGTPLRQLLSEIDYSQASTRTFDGVHTIWEIVLHMTAWKNEVRRRLGGAPAGTPTEGDWPAPAPANAQTWCEAVDALEDAHRALIGVISRTPESLLYTATNDARDPASGGGVSYYVLLHGIVQHDVYHSGQIALLKKAVS
jgi:uncharacterized damage-inducible protein DinB